MLIGGVYPRCLRTSQKLFKLPTGHCCTSTRSPEPDGKPPAVLTAVEASKQPVLGELCGLISISQSCFYFPSVTSQRPYHHLLTRCYFSYPRKIPFCVFYAYFLAIAREKTGIFEVFQIKPHVACSSENSLNAETHAKGLAPPFAPSASALAGSR